MPAVTTNPVQPRTVSVERVIHASPQAIFDVLADPAMHPRLDGSGTVQNPESADPARLALGSRFGMHMRIFVPYRITSQVVEFEEGRLIAWRHFGGHVWRWELEPADGGTRVRETFDWRPSRAPWFLELVGYPGRNRRGIEATLPRLAALVEPTV